MKYKITSEQKMFKGNRVYQIQATRDIPLYGVLKGDFGGWVDSEHALSQNGECWIESGVVYGASRISGDVLIDGETEISGESELSGEGYVEHSTMTGTLLIGKYLILSSHLHNCHLPKESEVRSSKLTCIENRQATKFKCSDSELRFQSEGELLEGVMEINRTKLASTHSMLKGDIHMEDVDICLEEGECHIFGKTVLRHLYSSGDETQLYFSDVTIAGETVENKVRLYGGVIDIEDSKILGNVSISGEVKVTNSSLQDYVRVDAKTACIVNIENSTVQDLVVIENKSESTYVIQNQQLSGDGMVEV